MFCAWIFMCKCTIWICKIPWGQMKHPCQFWPVLMLPACAPHLSWYCLHLAPLKSLAGTLGTWSALHEQGAGGLESGGLSLQTSLADSRGSKASKHHAAGARITDSLTAGVEWTAWCGSRSPLCLGSLCLCFSFSHPSQLRNEHCWPRKRRREKEWERGSQCDCVCACVSVSDCWLLEYKWDVLIHLNQGHMLGPRVKCSERNEALYCICHSAQEIKPGTFPALHEILRVTFKESVVINWLHDCPDCRRFSCALYFCHEWKIDHIWPYFLFSCILFSFSVFLRSGDILYYSYFHQIP